MADLLIKGMEMPKSCYTCQFGDNYEGSFCLATNDEHQIDHMTAIRRRPKWCPLVEVRPHGELKDFNDILTVFDKVIHDVDDKTNALLCDLLVQIQYAPTVLEDSNVF